MGRDPTKDTPGKRRKQESKSAESVVETVTFTSIDIDGGAIDGTVIGGTTPASGTFTGIKADLLDVTVINNTTVTTTTLEVDDKLIIASHGATSAESNAAGIQIGGTDSSDTVASILYDHSNTAIDFNIAGATELRIEQGGAIIPEKNDDIELGSSSDRFKNLWIQGIADVGGIATSGSVTIGASANTGSVVLTGSFKAGAMTGSGLSLLPAATITGKPGADLGAITGSSLIVAGNPVGADADIIGKPAADLGAVTGSAIYVRGGPITGSELSITKTITGKPGANLGAITGSTYTSTGPVYFDAVTTNVGAITGSGLWVYTGEVTIGAEADMGQVILTGSFKAGAVTGTHGTFGHLTGTIIRPTSQIYFPNGATITGKPGSDLGAITGSAIYLRGGSVTGSEFSIAKTITGKPAAILGAVTGTHGTFGQLTGSSLSLTGDFTTTSPISGNDTHWFLSNNAP